MTRNEEIDALPVPPAIRPNVLAVLVSAGAFLSACIAKSPVGRRCRCKVWPLCKYIYLKSAQILTVNVPSQTLPLVLQQTSWSSEVNHISDPQTLQILGHLSPFWELWVHVLKINLQKAACQLWYYHLKPQEILQAIKRIWTFTTRSTNPLSSSLDTGV